METKSYSYTLISYLKTRAGSGPPLSLYSSPQSRSEKKSRHPF